MNFRSTTALFGLLLGMLWLFGLTVAHKKTAVDPSFLMPRLQANPDVVIDSIVIERRVKDKPAEEIQFTMDKDAWYLKVPGAQKSVKLEAFRVNQIVSQIKDARRSDEAGVTDDLVKYGLAQPAITVTLKGKAKDKPEQAWKFFIGRESSDQALMYVNSSDRPDKVYAIAKNNIDSVLFKDPNHLRSRRIFEFSDSAVQLIDIKEGPAELALKKGEDWRLEKPAYGVADFEGPPAPKDLPPGAKPPEGGVKGLLAAIATVRVDSEDDFVPPQSGAKLETFGLEDGKEAMRIEVGTPKEKSDKKEVAKEILAIGARVKDKSQVYARMVGDEGIFKLNSKLLEPIRNVLLDPGSLRSMEVVSIDTKKVDAVTIVQGKETVSLLHPEGKAWELQVGTGKLEKANSQAAQALLDAVQGKRDIGKFYDGDDFNKLDAEMKNPVAVVALFLGGLEEAKKEASPDKKDGGKDSKDAKKEETPKLKKDAKPAVTLSFGTAGKEMVNVQRVLADGTTSRFTVPKSILERVTPGDISLAFLDTALPEVAPDDVDRVVLVRDKEKLDIEKGWGDKANRWFFKEGEDALAKSLTDPAKTGLVVNSLTVLAAKKWLHKIDPKEDLDKYGLTKPALTVTMRIRKDRPAATVSLVGLLASFSEWRGLLGGAAVLANRFAGPGETVVLKIGKETDQEKDKPAAYAVRSDKDTLFLVPGDLVRLLREIDLRDRTSVVVAQPVLNTAVVGLAAANGPSALVAGSPLMTNLVQSFDAAKVKELKLAIRTREELRILNFQRDPATKEKEWRDQSGLREFNLDSQKVTQLVEQLAALKASRWINVGGGAKSEQKLTAKEATLRIDVMLDDGKTITLTVGAPFEKTGYYAQTTVFAGAVFLLAPTQVEPLLQGPGYFAKERVAGARSEE